MKKDKRFNEYHMKFSIYPQMDEISHLINRLENCQLIVKDSLIGNLEMIEIEEIKRLQLKQLLNSIDKLIKKAHSELLQSHGRLYNIERELL